MNMSFFNAAVGAQQQQQRMNVQANNIANVNTHGFKAERATFAQLMYRGCHWHRRGGAAQGDRDPHD